MKVSSVKKKKEAEPSAPLWLVTYGDLMTQLLIFFAMLVAVQQARQVKLQDIIVSIQSAFNPFTPVQTHQRPTSSTFTFLQKVEELVRTRPSLAIYARGDMEAPEGEYPLVTSIREGPRIIVGGLASFDRDSAVLKEPAQRVLVDVARAAAGVENVILVRGHADRDELSGIASERYGDHWGLAYARAHAVMRFLTEQIDEGVRLPVNRIRIESAGREEPLEYLPHYFFGDNAEEARAKNRRFEVLVSEETIDRASGQPRVGLGD